MSREPKEDYDWINDPFDEKKIAEERERMGMSGTSKTFVGIGCQLSDDWTYYTDEQLAELSGVVAESSEEMQKAMEDGKSTYDMFASAMEGLVTINVVYEDLGALYGKLLDEAGYLEIAVPKLEDASGLHGAIQREGGADPGAVRRSGSGGRSLSPARWTASPCMRRWCASSRRAICAA